MDDNETRRIRLVEWFLALAGIAMLIWAALGTEADAHLIAGTDIPYPSGCCNSAATSPNGDCSPIDDQYVTEGPDGYEINLPVGAHPQLRTKGYKGVVPYSTVRQPLDWQFHICLSRDGGHRYCFFPKPGSV